MPTVIPSGTNEANKKNKAAYLIISLVINILFRLFVDINCASLNVVKLMNIICDKSYVEIVYIPYMA